MGTLHFHLRGFHPRSQIRRTSIVFSYLGMVVEHYSTIILYIKTIILSSIIYRILAADCPISIIFTILNWLDSPSLYFYNNLVYRTLRIFPQLKELIIVYVTIYHARNKIWALPMVSADCWVWSSVTVRIDISFSRLTPPCDATLATLDIAVAMSPELFILILVR